MEKAQTAMFGVISIRYYLNFLKFVYYVVCNLYYIRCLPALVLLLYTNHADSVFIFRLFQNDLSGLKIIL